MRYDLVDPWLVAIWPGMGSVALTAGNHLVQRLGAQPLMAIPASDYFEVEKVEIQKGIARKGWLPDCTLYGWKNPGSGRDLLFFIGESQPSRGGYEFCRRVLEEAARFRVRRVFTFAAMATKIHPTADPRIFGVTNEQALLPELRGEGVEVLQEGQINGLNGVMLAAAADLGVEGVCLLGEIPFFAISVPNPKASARVLRVFSRMADFRVDLLDLRMQAATLEKSLVELVDRLNISSDDSDELPTEFPGAFPVGELSLDVPADPAITAGDRMRIEGLFAAARDDRQKAGELKNELDRLGAFPEYEDRFLDLFKSS